MTDPVAVGPPVLVASDSFKGTFSALETSSAIAKGLIAGGRQAELCPLADGGEGTLDALLATERGSEVMEITVSGPLGKPTKARIGLFDAGATAVVETADAIGLTLIPSAERDPELASSRGAGELIAAAIQTKAERVLIGVGGSATVDGGRAAIEVLEANNLTVNRLGKRSGPQLTVLCDVRAPWEDAVRLFAPQKGAGVDSLELLVRRLEVIAEGLRRDPRGVAMTGAAGGLAGALWSECGAELKLGANEVLSTVDFDRRMRASRAVIVGEGQLDSTTLLGKAAGEAATRARQAGVPCAAVCGSNRLDPIEARILDLQVVIEASDIASLEAAGRKLAALI
ncbi:MAG: glycerate kinase [Actinomycetes bacterium]